MKSCIDCINPLNAKDELYIIFKEITYLTYFLSNAFIYTVRIKCKLIIMQFRNPYLCTVFLVQIQTMLNFSDLT